MTYNDLIELFGYYIPGELLANAKDNTYNPDYKREKSE